MSHYPPSDVSPAKVRFRDAIKQVTLQADEKMDCIYKLSFGPIPRLEVRSLALTCLSIYRISQLFA